MGSRARSISLKSSNAQTGNHRGESISLKSNGARFGAPPLNISA
jgi:hypothetical protein